MGHVPTTARNPYEYLKKYSGIKQEYKDTKQARCECKEQQRTKTKSQTTMDQEGMILRDTSKRNFIRENALNVIRRPASTPNPRLVDDRKGNSIDLEHSGLVPKYLQKEDYGEVPKYLRRDPR
ncbi:enkurin-like [Uloborus diversus]|uniref:enkurin-like n=1 Tax=Uloborus diversus TaxID=327109 RepID=UPI00240A8866|nr:enkurin-like [Uloborus diversus]